MNELIKSIRAEEQRQGICTNSWNWTSVIMPSGA
jgi:hypothetical protein